MGTGFGPKRYGFCYMTVLVVRSKTGRFGVPNPTCPDTVSRWHNGCMHHVYTYMLPWPYHGMYGYVVQCTCSDVITP